MSPFLSDISCQVFNSAVRVPDASEVWKLLHPHAWEMLLIFHRVVQRTEPLQTVNAETELPTHQYLWFINYDHVLLVGLGLDTTTRNRHFPTKAVF